MALLAIPEHTFYCVQCYQHCSDAVGDTYLRHNFLNWLNENVINL